MNILAVFILRTYAICKKDIIVLFIVVGLAASETALTIASYKVQFFISIIKSEYQIILAHDSVIGTLPFPLSRFGSCDIHYTPSGTK